RDVIEVVTLQVLRKRDGRAGPEAAGGERARHALLPVVRRAARERDVRSRVLGEALRVAVRVRLHRPRDRAVARERVGERDRPVAAAARPVVHLPEVEDDEAGRLLMTGVAALLAQDLDRRRALV